MDVLRAALSMGEDQTGVALAVVVGTHGGAVRNTGALMAVASDGRYAGYLSGGCIDADIVARAQDVIAQGQGSQVRYGAGSDKLDITLPCGGAIEVLICAHPDRLVLAETVQQLDGRRAASIGFSGEGGLSVGDSTINQAGWRRETFLAAYTPKMALRVAGRGAEVIAMARLSAGMGMACKVQTPDDLCIEAARLAGVSTVERLLTPQVLPLNSDDPWTAFVLMFHDTDWETSLLADALSGQAFFVGAVGSRRTQARRQSALADLGLSADLIDRIRGPIGLAPAMRDATMLSVSAMAEICDVFTNGDRRDA